MEIFWFILILICNFSDIGVLFYEQLGPHSPQCPGAWCLLESTFVEHQGEWCGGPLGDRGSVVQQKISFPLTLNGSMHAFPFTFPPDVVHTGKGEIESYCKYLNNLTRFTYHCNHFHNNLPLRSDHWHWLYLGTTHHQIPHQLWCTHSTIYCCTTCSH